MKKFEVKKIDIKSAAKIWLTFGLIMGLFAGIIILFIGLINSPKSFLLTLLFAFLAICFYGLVGAMMAALGSLVYNMVADKIGGVEVYLNEKNERYIAPGPNKQDNYPDDTKIT